MVLIARAIAQQTRIIIMDEPCSNLDYGNQIKVLKTIKELAKQGYLIIQSTHNPEHVFLFSDEVLVIMDGGRKSERAG
jgi:iron complex transport system ATP-binding protein